MLARTMKEETVSAETSSRLELIAESKKRARPRAPKFLKLADWIADRLMLESSKRHSWAAIPLSLLDHPEFEELADETKWHLVGLMMLVKRIGFNHLPNNGEHLQRKIGAKSSIDLAVLMKKGFILPVKNEVKSKRIKSEKCAIEGDVDRFLQQQDRTKQKQDTHTTTDEQSAADADAGAAVGAGSHYPYKTCLAFAQHQKDTGQLIGGRPIENVGGLARTYQREGSADIQIGFFLNPETAPKLKQADPNCTHCFGSGMMNPDGRGARKCDCRK